MSNEALPHCLREVCLDGGEPAAVHRAWTKHPGRNGNDVISKDFRAGWQAGRDWQRQQAPERPCVDDELLAALEIIGRGDCGTGYSEMPGADCLAMQQAARDGTLTPNWERAHRAYFLNGEHLCRRCRAREAIRRAEDATPHADGQQGEGPA